MRSSAVLFSPALSMRRPAAAHHTNKTVASDKVESGKALLDLYGRGQIGQGDVATCGTGRGEPEIEIDLAGQFRIHLIVHLPRLAAIGRKVAMKERKSSVPKASVPVTVGSPSLSDRSSTPAPWLPFRSIWTFLHLDAVDFAGHGSGHGEGHRWRRRPQSRSATQFEKAPQRRRGKAAGAVQIGLSGKDRRSLEGKRCRRRVEADRNGASTPENRRSGWALAASKVKFSPRQMPLRI